MIFRNRVFAERHMTFRADEIWIFLSTINFEIQRAAVISCRGDVTAVRPATRSHRNFDRFQIDRAEGCAVDLVTVETT